MSKYVDVEPIIEYAQEQVTGIFAYPQGARKEDERAERQAWRVVRDYLVNAQDVDVAEVKHGRWEMKEDPFCFFDTIPVCSECGSAPMFRLKSAYCQNCGARMDGEEE